MLIWLIIIGSSMFVGYILWQSDQLQSRIKLYQVKRRLLVKHWWLVLTPWSAICLTSNGRFNLYNMQLNCLNMSLMLHVQAANRSKMKFKHSHTLIYRIPRLFCQNVIRRTNGRLMNSRHGCSRPGRWPTGLGLHDISSIFSTFS